MKKIQMYEWAVVFGAVAGPLSCLQDTTFTFPSFILIGFGLAGGIFVGMMAAALTEVLNVWPILAKRIGVEEKIVILMMALYLEKYLVLSFIGFILLTTSK